ncbi:MAG: hypothetical protein ACJAQ1_001090 [Flavobacterium sp.]|jgi:hypothetical protein
MSKKDFFIGFFIGITAPIIGIYGFLLIFTDFSQTQNLNFLIEQNLLGKVITLGTILNVVVFLLLMRFKKDLMAHGVLMATIILAIATIFV